MADFSSSIIPLKTASSESIVIYNDQPQSGLIDNVTRTEYVTYTN